MDDLTVSDNAWPVATRLEQGVMVMKDGKAWGIEWEDGQSTSYGWIDPTKAPIHDPRYCRRPQDVTYAGSYLLPELAKGKLVRVCRVTTVYDLEAKEQAP